MKKILLCVFALAVAGSGFAAAGSTPSSAAVADFLSSLAPLDGRESEVDFEGAPKPPPAGTVKSVFAVIDSTHFKLTRMSKGTDGAWTPTSMEEYEFLPEQRDTGSANPAIFCGYLKVTRLKPTPRELSFFCSCALQTSPGDPTLHLIVYAGKPGAIPTPDERKAPFSYVAWENNRNYLNIQAENPKNPAMKVTQGYKR